MIFNSDGFAFQFIILRNNIGVYYDYHPILIIEEITRNLYLIFHNYDEDIYYLEGTSSIKNSLFEITMLI